MSNKLHKKTKNNDSSQDVLAQVKLEKNDKPFGDALTEAVLYVMMTTAKATKKYFCMTNKFSLPAVQIIDMNTPADVDEEKKSCVVDDDLMQTFTAKAMFILEYLGHLWWGIEKNKNILATYSLDDYPLEIIKRTAETAPGYIAIGKVQKLKNMEQVMDAFGPNAESMKKQVLRFAQPIKTDSGEWYMGLRFETK